MLYKTYDIYVPLYNGTISELIPGYGKSPLKLTLDQSAFSSLQSAGKSFQAPIIVLKVNSNGISSDFNDASNDEKINALSTKVNANASDITTLKNDVSGKASADDIKGLAKAADLDTKADKTELTGLAKTADLDAYAKESEVTQINTAIEKLQADVKALQTPAQTPAGQ